MWLKVFREREKILNIWMTKGFSIFQRLSTKCFFAFAILQLWAFLLSYLVKLLCWHYSYFMCTLQYATHNDWEKKNLLQTDKLSTPLVTSVNQYTQSTPGPTNPTLLPTHILHISTFILTFFFFFTTSQFSAVYVCSPI